MDEVIDISPFVKDSDGDYDFKVRIPGKDYVLAASIDLHALIVSLASDECDEPVLTCGCGIAECAGFWKEHCKRSADVIHWSIREKQTDFELFFDRDAYERGAIEMLADLVGRKTGWDALGCPPHNSFEEFEEHVDWLLDQEPYLKEIWERVRGGT